jgi:hypothetical protein
MILISRHIQFDKRLQVYALEMVADGENERLTFRTKAAAQRAQRELLAGGAEYLPPSWDGAL